MSEERFRLTGSWLRYQNTLLLEGCLVELLVLLIVRFVGRNRIRLRGITEGYNRGAKRHVCRALLSHALGPFGLVEVDLHEQTRLHDDVQRRLVGEVPQV